MASQSQTFHVPIENVKEKSSNKLGLIELIALVVGSMIGGGSSRCHRIWRRGHHLQQY